MASFLLDRGANPNHAGAGWNALHQTVRWRRPNPMGGKPGPIPSGSVDSIDVVRKMLAKGADVNARMRNNGMKDGQRNRLIRTGATPFLLAAKNADVEAMKVLLEAGADASIATLENVTPLMVAAGLYIYHVGEDGGSLSSDADDVLEAVRLCLERGNDVNAVDRYGHTALHGAAFRGLNPLVELLAAKGGKLDARTYDYDPDQQKFLMPGEQRKNPGEKSIRGWTPLAIANGLSYAAFYVDQPHTADLLRTLMKARGLSTEGEIIESRVALDNAPYVNEREKDMDALAATVFGRQ
jgi:ankyrin repeat protein